MLETHAPGHGRILTTHERESAYRGKSRRLFENLLATT